MLSHTHRFTTSLGVILGGIGALTIASCSGGGSTPSTPGSIEALSVGDQMSVVTTSGGSAASVVPHSQADTSGFAATCDYNTDVANAHVFDPSMESLQTVNMILCLLKQTAYASLLNEGVYKAQVDENSCNNGGNDNSTGQSSGTQQSFNIWIVESTRASNTGAQTVEFWVPNQGESGDGQIRVRMTVTEGASDANPFGVFDLNFIEYEQDGTTISGLGNLHTLDVLDGFIGFGFYQEKGDVTVPQTLGNHAEMVQANVNMFSDQSQGVAHILNQRRENYNGTDSGVQSTEYALAFNDTNVLRSTDQSGTGDTCLSRTNFAKRTWRYNLYDAANGARVELNSGFGFQTEAGAYGWIGYYGLWAPPNVTLASGDTVTRNTYGQGTAEAYTVLMAPGKLVKNERNTIPLTQLSGVTFEWWQTFMDIGGPILLRQQLEYLDSAWYVTHYWDNETNSWAAYDPAALLSVGSGQVLNMYSQSLNGQCSYKGGDDSVLYYKQSFVGPNDSAFDVDGHIDLSGYQQTLRSGITSQDASTGYVYNDDSFVVAEPWTYYFDRTTMTLFLNGNTPAAAGLASGAEITSGPYQWGLRSGPMVTSTTGLVNTGDVWNQDVFYTYETGSNPWNKFVTLLDSNGVSVQFDPPLQFAYTHHTADDANADTSFDGHTFVLNYNGPGNLGGIPNIEIDFNNDGNTDRWLPAFAIADGTLCGPTGTEYVIRAIDSELSLIAAPGACSLLTTGPVFSLTLPTVADWTDPAMGATPTVPDAPRVIEGAEVGSGS